MRYKDLDFWEKILLCVLVLTAVYFPFFLHLDSFPIQQYDEAIFAFRAYHIAEHGTPLKNFGIYDHIWEFTNSKPPLFSYIQALSFKVFGYNELSIRLPVALSGAITCLLIIYLCNKHFKDLYSGIFSALILCTSVGYLGTHMARFGDQDVPFALFVFLFTYHFYLFLKSRKFRFLTLAILWFAIAFLIKSVAVFLVLPGILVYAFFQKNFTEFLKKNSSKLLWAFIVVCLFISLLYLYDSQQLISTLTNYKRFNTEIDPYHVHGFWFYLEVFKDWGYFTPWLFLLPISILPIILKSDRKDILLYLWSISIFEWLSLSLAKTKIPHYSAPLYIFLSLIIGITLGWVFRYLSTYFSNRFKLKPWALFFFISVLIFYAPYKYIIEHVAWKKDYDKRHYISCLLKRRTDIKEATIVDSEYNLSQAFYINIRNNEQGYKYDKIPSVDSSIVPPTIVLTCKNKEIKKLSEIFVVDTVDAKYFCGVFWVKSRKDTGNVLPNAEID